MTMRKSLRPQDGRASVAPLVGAAIVAAMLAAPLDARAHAVLDTGTATAGAYHKLVVRIGHGCAGQPTVELTIELPAGISGGKPQPKPGWQVAVAREPWRSRSATATATGHRPRRPRHLERRPARGQPFRRVRRPCPPAQPAGRDAAHPGRAALRDGRASLGRGSRTGPAPGQPEIAGPGPAPAAAVLKPRS